MTHNTLLKIMKARGYEVTKKKFIKTWGEILVIRHNARLLCPIHGQDSRKEQKWRKKKSGCVCGWRKSSVNRSIEWFKFAGQQSCGTQFKNSNKLHKVALTASTEAHIVINKFIDFFLTQAVSSFRLVHIRVRGPTSNSLDTITAVKR